MRDCFRLARMARDRLPSPTRGLLARAVAAKNGDKFKRLWTGDTSGYASPSEAVMALCELLAWWTNRDATRIDRLFRQSGLFSPKWDDRRGASTWGAHVLTKALDRTPKGYTPATTTPSARRDESIEDLQTFLSRMESQPPLSWHIPGLIPDEGICLWHGQPRDFKSMCAQEVALALAAGRPAFSIPRFAVPSAVKVAYLTEEDPERLFAARMHWLTAKNPMPAAGMFFLFVRKSLSFDVDTDREFILRTIIKTGVTVVVFDPVRSYTGLSDKGPADLRPVALFLRRIQNETTAKTLVIIHHRRPCAPHGIQPAAGSAAAAATAAHRPVVSRTRRYRRTTDDPRHTDRGRHGTSRSGTACARQLRAAGGGIA